MSIAAAVPVFVPDLKLPRLPSGSLLQEDRFMDGDPGNFAKPTPADSLPVFDSSEDVLC